MSRVTQQSIASSTLANLQLALGRVSQTQEQLSSGRLINRPSDSPTGTVSALQLRAETASTEQYARNAQDGLDWLGTADSALTTSLSTLNRARDLVVAARSGAASPASREALATEVEQLRGHLLSLANSSFGGRPVFAGTAGTDVAFRPDGTYAGDAGSVERRIGPATTLRVDTPGEAAFGPNGQVFALLEDIAADLRSGAPTLGARLDDLDAAHGRMLTAVADVGARYARLVATQQTADSRLLDLRSSLAEVESVDLPKAVMDLQIQEVAYQAALGSSAKVLQPSLMDYLR